MSDETADVYSYDEVPYSSWPYPQSHPDRLATMATIFGMEPQPINHARVLEVGCAAAGNLIPMAELLPESEFIGIDLSARELEEGKQAVARLGLENIQVHPTEAYVDLKRCGHDGPIWGCTNDFRQEDPACPRRCCTMDSGCVTTVA